MSSERIFGKNDGINIMDMLSANISLTSNESEIFELLQKIEQGNMAYEVLYLSISKLQNTVLKNSERKILKDTFLLLSAEVKIVELYNNDLVIFYKKEMHDVMLSCLVKARFLLQDDDVVKTTDDLIQAKIAKFYDLMFQQEELKQVIFDKVNQKKSVEKQKIQNDFVPLVTGAIRRNKKNLSPQMLAKVKKILSVADFSSFIRRQSICAIIGHSAPQRVFDEVYVSIPDLREMLLPDVDLTSNPWLFLSLSETLDKGVLETISRHDDGSLISNFSVNINVSTILSDEFLEFDDSVNVSMRSSIILELQLADMFSDLKAFMLAKTFAQARGYKVCIDGITVDKLKYINRANLDCDLMKIIWHPSFAEVINEDKHFTDYVNKAERAKMILCRIDDPTAIEVGNSLGINLYQGRYVQKLLSQQARNKMLNK